LHAQHHCTSSSWAPGAPWEPVWRAVRRVRPNPNPTRGGSATGYRAAEQVVKVNWGCGLCRCGGVTFAGDCARRGFCIEAAPAAWGFGLARLVGVRVEKWGPDEMGLGFGPGNLIFIWPTKSGAHALWLQAKERANGPPKAQKLCLHGASNGKRSTYTSLNYRCSLIFLLN
jgi:hypothetical protein